MNKQNEFSDKKLLILGDSVSSSEIIEIAKSYGATTIAVDYNHNSAFKKIADKSYDINTADIEALAKLVEKEGVTGVLTGASEFNIDKAITLCERTGLPFYTTRNQWDTLSNKRDFKDLCKRFGVPVVEEYSDENDSDMIFPVIVKPVDSCAGIGISVCRTKSEFEEGRALALQKSASKKLIIERYMEGDEVVLYYTIQDGYVSFSAMCDRYTYKQKGVAPLPTAYVFPSKYIDDFIKYDNQNVIKMFNGMGLKNGFLFVQAFVDNGRIAVYEMGYRIAGAQGHKPIMAANGINPLEMLVRFALGGKMDGYDLKTQDEPKFAKFVCKLTPILKVGAIDKIEGLDAISKLSYVTDVVPIHHEGDDMTSVGTLNQILARIFLVAETKDSLKNRINEIQSLIKVYDKDGNDLILKFFDVKTLD